ncbi:hypothetical protein KR074_005476, partial [Drosophila pseudoananassae]
MVALFSNEKFIGGGSLIAMGAVLTAAHILENVTAADLKIRAGDWDLSSDRESFSPQERLVKNIIRHEDFDYETGANDLALVILAQPLKQEKHIQTICLPTPDYYTQDSCMVAGWGVKNFGDENLSNVLKVIKLPKVYQEDCQDQLRKTELGPDFKLDPSLMCAGGVEGVDSCTGDGGSALFCEIDGTQNRYVQVGIVNWGMECGKKGIPGVYTNLEKFNDWINKQLEANPAIK